jgi:NADP-dependent 3-hydroxy acid dehydrogenase YdfG
MVKQRVSGTSQQTRDIRRTPFVTGTSTGTGQATARALRDSGFVVYEKTARIYSAIVGRNSAPAKAIIV